MFMISGEAGAEQKNFVAKLIDFIVCAAGGVIRQAEKLFPQDTFIFPIVTRMYSGNFAWCYYTGEHSTFGGVPVGAS